MKEDSRERKKHWIHSVVGNNRMESIFGRIGLKKFVGFSSKSGWKEEAVGGSGLENNEKNDWTLSMNDSK